MYTLSDARANAKPILQGLTEADLLILVNEVLADRPASLTNDEVDAMEWATKGHMRDSVQQGRDMFAEAHKKRSGTGSGWRPTTSP